MSVYLELMLQPLPRLIPFFGDPAYQKKFREARKNPDETHKMFKTRLENYLSYYIPSKGIDTLESMLDDVVCEQLLFVLPSVVKQFVLSKQAHNAEECCRYADLFTEMEWTTSVSQVQGGALSGGRPQVVWRNGYSSNTQPVQSAVTGSFRGTKMSNGTQGRAQGGVQTGGGNNVRCYACNSLGHKRTECPNVDKNGAGVCSNCKCFHPFHIPCYSRGFNNVYATAVSENVCVHSIVVWARGVVTVRR